MLRDHVLTLEFKHSLQKREGGALKCSSIWNLKAQMQGVLPSPWIMQAVAAKARQQQATTLTFVHLHANKQAGLLCMHPSFQEAALFF